MKVFKNNAVINKQNINAAKDCTKAHLKQNAEHMRFARAKTAAEKIMAVNIRQMFFIDCNKRRNMNKERHNHATYPSG